LTSERDFGSQHVVFKSLHIVLILYSSGAAKVFNLNKAAFGQLPVKLAPLFDLVEALALALPPRLKLPPILTDGIFSDTEAEPPTLALPLAEPLVEALTAGVVTAAVVEALAFGTATLAAALVGTPTFNPPETEAPPETLALLA
jgi:hypothetical protein